MAKDIGGSVVESRKSHSCGLSCLGHLVFHCPVVGDKIRLSQGCRLAERMGPTFKSGLVFSSRSVRRKERICLRVERGSCNWHGALRVGFTNVPPAARSLPLPPLSIPNLTDTPGHWAAAVHESYCQEGSVLEFWVSHGGTVYIANNSTKQKLLTGVDVRRPLWAMIDVYGQTRSILLLGSRRKGMFCTRYSCPAPERPTSPDIDYSNSLMPDEDIDDKSRLMECVVCMLREARITLPCGHRCLCPYCANRVMEEFGRCPLCRHSFTAPSVGRNL